MSWPIAIALTCLAATMGNALDSLGAGGEKRRFSAMHAVVEIIVPADSGSETAPAKLADMAEAIIRKLDSLLSPKGENSDVRRLNETPPGEWVSVDPLTMRVIEQALRWHKMTDGLFEPTIGPLKKLFRFDGKILREWPSEAAVREAKERIGADKLAVDDTGCRLSWIAPGMSLDLGGIAKGFAADAAAETLARHGVKNCVISVGGEMRVLGSRPGTPPVPWQIGITDPRGKDMTYVAEVVSRALATSGDYQSYFEHEGKRYSHIIDPRSGLPLPEKVAGATVSHPRSATTADALATVMCILGSEKGAEFVGRHWLEADLAGVDVVLFEIADGGDVAAVAISVDEAGGVTVNHP